MKMLINGAWAGSLSGQTMDVTDPYTGQVIDVVPKAGKEDIDLALDAAVMAQKSWAETPFYQRAAVLRKYLQLVEDSKEDLAQTLSLDNGKTIREARGEIGNIFTAVPAFIGKAAHLYDTIIPMGLEKGTEHIFQTVKRCPVGVVVCIVPFNFPVNLFTQKMVPALLSGNAVVVLPPSGNPLTILRLCSLLMQAGVPAGVIQCLTAPGSEKEYALTDPRTALVTFTGSTRVGLRTAGLCSRSLKPYALELGGNDPFVVFDDADLDVAVTEAMAGRMQNAGQICCACKRFIVQDSVAEEFTRRIVEKVSQIRLGAPADPATDMGCLINEKAARTVEEQVERTLEQGARLACGGKRKGAVYQPTVLTHVSKDMDISKNMEVFGPVIPIIPFSSDEEALEIANQTSYGLGSAIFTKDLGRMKKFSDQLQAGTVIINGSSRFRSFEMPFGGWKMSGVGTEGVMSTFEEMTRTKVVALKGI